MKSPIKGNQYKEAPQNTSETYPSLSAKNLFRYSFHISGKPKTNFFKNHEGNAGEDAFQLDHKSRKNWNEIRLIICTKIIAHRKCGSVTSFQQEHRFHQMQS